MEILARAVGRRKEAVAQVQLVRGNGQFLINDKPAQAYLQNNSCSLICIKSPLEAALSLYSNNFLNEQSTSSEAITIKVGNDKLDEQSQAKLTASFDKQTEQSEILNHQDKGLALKENGGETTLPNSSANEDKTSSSEQSLNDSKQFSLTSVVSLDEIDVIIKVKGGGLIGQAEAIKLGIARAFCIMQASIAGGMLRKILKTKGYLTQDSRVKERRKYGLKKARKASQYHKR